ncbi:hypothetical protein B0H16DRAFT_1448029 [Mycena metata]|uniref:Uncharacterized protein n=1 Tax=Mycena metata TaxID=1033252 RepID=A0AAD7KAM1_9AGAR|nr:hypothetical protein B0H16DRAFT_1448029 [Mycena metata]
MMQRLKGQPLAFRQPPNLPSLLSSSPVLRSQFLDLKYQPQALKECSWCSVQYVLSFSAVDIFSLPYPSSPILRRPAPPLLPPLPLPFPFLVACTPFSPPSSRTFLIVARARRLAQYLDLALPNASLFHTFKVATQDSQLAEFPVAVAVAVDIFKTIKLAQDLSGILLSPKDLKLATQDPQPAELAVRHRRRRRSSRPSSSLKSEDLSGILSSRSRPQGLKCQNASTFKSLKVSNLQVPRRIKISQDLGRKLLKVKYTTRFKTRVEAAGPLRDLSRRLLKAQAQNLKLQDAAKLKTPQHLKIQDSARPQWDTAQDSRRRKTPNFKTIKPRLLKPSSLETPQVLKIPQDLGREPFKIITASSRRMVEDLSGRLRKTQDVARNQDSSSRKT